MGYRKDIIIKADAGDYMKELDKNYLAPIASKSMVDIVVSRLTEAIISGELKPGRPDPSGVGTGPEIWRRAKYSA